MTPQVHLHMSNISMVNTESAKSTTHVMLLHPWFFSTATWHRGHCFRLLVLMAALKLSSSRRFGHIFLRPLWALVPRQHVAHVLRRHLVHCTKPDVSLSICESCGQAGTELRRREKQTYLDDGSTSIIRAPDFAFSIEFCGDVLVFLLEGTSEESGVVFWLDACLAALGELFGVESGSEPFLKAGHAVSHTAAFHSGHLSDRNIFHAGAAFIQPWP